MSDELVLYTNPMSRGRIVRWMLEEVGQPYRVELLAFGATQTADFLAVNPMGKVPALRHGDTVVTETAAICAYLADAFPKARLAPASGDKLRGVYYRWLFFAAGPMEAAITNSSLGFETPQARQSMTGYGSLERVMDVLDGALAGGGYLAGESFTAADLYVGAQISFGLMFNSIEQRPAFLAFRDRVSERPAAKRANEIDDALMAQAQTSTA